MTIPHCIDLVHPLYLLHHPPTTHIYPLSLHDALPISSFTAAGWEASFYPQGMRPKDFLRHYASWFQTVEIDSTFYGTPSASTRSEERRVGKGVDIGVGRIIKKKEREKNELKTIRMM